MKFTLWIINEKFKDFIEIRKMFQTFEQQKFFWIYIFLLFLLSKTTRLATNSLCVKTPISWNSPRWFTFFAGAVCVNTALSQIFLDSTIFSLRSCSQNDQQKQRDEDNFFHNFSYFWFSRFNFVFLIVELWKLNWFFTQGLSFYMNLRSTTVLVLHGKIKLKIQ